MVNHPNRKQPANFEVYFPVSGVVVGERSSYADAKRLARKFAGECLIRPKTITVGDLGHGVNIGSTT